ncbi:MAG: hypothetical protein HGA45_18980 [Chloroflexales bacterium]|nr:hypothetical protein [Chloroflexales bacterium]
MLSTARRSDKAAQPGHRGAACVDVGEIWSSTAARAPAWPSLDKGSADLVAYHGEGGGAAVLARLVLVDGEGAEGRADVDVGDRVAA